MSKYAPLWNYIINSNAFPLKLSFNQIENILGFKIDHSFLSYKKELLALGYNIEKISLKNKFIIINK